MTALMIDETMEDMDTAINAISDEKHGIPHPHILIPLLMKKTIQEENHQHLLDISEITVAVIKGLFTYVVQIPVLEKEEGSLQHIIPITEKIHDIHMSIISNYDYVFK